MPAVASDGNHDGVVLVASFISRACWSRRSTSCRHSRRQLFLNNTKLSKEDITGQVKDRLTNRLDKTSTSRAMLARSMANGVAVVDEIRSAGVDQLGLLTEKASPRLPRAPPSATGD